MPCETSCCGKRPCLLRERHLIFAKIRTNIRAFLFEKRYSHDATALSGFACCLGAKKGAWIGGDAGGGIKRGRSERLKLHRHLLLFPGEEEPYFPRESGREGKREWKHSPPRPHFP